MTQKLFWQAPYQTQLDTRITHVDGDDIMVAQTIFYAFSGAQESDAGTIANRDVLQARKEGREIIYTLENGHGLHVGDPVRIEIDWERRYALMRLHFAAEIVLELVTQHTETITKIGAHIAQNKARIDFVMDANITTLFPVIEPRARALIEADHSIVSAFSDEAAEKRYWEIAGFARVPCGGTHPRTTGEVGPIVLKRRNPGKGKERIEIFLADG